MSRRQPPPPVILPWRNRTAVERHSVDRCGGGADGDDIPEGPVVDENVHVVIHEKDSNTNLLKNTGRNSKRIQPTVLPGAIRTATAPMMPVKNVTDQYDYRCTVTPAQLQVLVPAVSLTKAGTIKTLSSHQRADAKTAFEGADGGVTVVDRYVQRACFVHRLQTQIKVVSTYHLPAGSEHFA